ncbi:hypothetical protein JOM56_006698 [Amanita muscaria]
MLHYCLRTRRKYYCVDCPLLHGSVIRTCYLLITNREQVYIFFRGIVKPFTTPPYFIMLYALVELLFLILTSSVTPILSNITQNIIWVLHAILLAVLIGISGTLPLKAFKPTNMVAQPGQTPSNTLTCPEDDVTLWSWCTHSFIEPIFVIANSRTLDETDVWSLSPFFQNKIIFSKLLDYRARCGRIPLECTLEMTHS